MEKYRIIKKADILSLEGKLRYYPQWYYKSKNRFFFGKSGWEYFQRPLDVVLINFNTKKEAKKFLEDRQVYELVN